MVDYSFRVTHTSVSNTSAISPIKLLVLQFAPWCKCYLIFLLVPSRLSQHLFTSPRKTSGNNTLPTIQFKRSYTKQSEHQLISPYYPGPHKEWFSVISKSSCREAGLQTDPSLPIAHVTWCYSEANEPHFCSPGSFIYTRHLTTWMLLFVTQEGVSAVLLCFREPELLFLCRESPPPCHRTASACHRFPSYKPIAKAQAWWRRCS